MSVRSHKTRSMRVEKAKKQTKHNKKLLAQTVAARIRKTNLDFEKNLHVHRANLDRYADMCKLMEAEGPLTEEDTVIMQRVKTTIATFSNLLQKIELMRAGVAMQDASASVISEDDAHEFMTTMMDLHGSIITDLNELATSIDLMKNVKQFMRSNAQSTGEPSSDGQTSAQTESNTILETAVTDTFFERIPSCDTDVVTSTSSD